MKWLKENPYPPQYMPSKTTTLYKKKNSVFPTNLNKAIYDSYVSSYTNKSNDRLNKLTDIYRKNKPTQLLCDYDLIDRQFKPGELIKIDLSLSCSGIVKSVLDEQLFLQIEHEGINGVKKKDVTWIDTDSSKIMVIEGLSSSSSKSLKDVNKI